MVRLDRIGWHAGTREPSNRPNPRPALPERGVHLAPRHGRRRGAAGDPDRRAADSTYDAHPRPRHRTGARPAARRGHHRRPQRHLATRYCAGVDQHGRNTYNVLDVTLSPTPSRRSNPCTPEPALLHHFGLRGVRHRLHRGSATAPMRYRLTGTARVRAGHIIALPDRARGQQQAFKTTGGVHAAALVNRTASWITSGRMSAGTTPSTRSSAPRCWPTSCRSPAGRC